MLWWIVAPDTISAHDVSIKILRRSRAEHSCPHHNMFFKKACSVPSCFWVLWPTLSIISWIWIAGAVLCKNPKMNFCYLRMLKTKWFLFRAEDQETTWVSFHVNSYTFTCLGTLRALSLRPRISYQKAPSAMDPLRKPLSASVTLSAKWRGAGVLRKVLLNSA
jgi:hypothetical protein